MCLCILGFQQYIFFVFKKKDWHALGEDVVKVSFIFLKFLVVCLRKLTIPHIELVPNLKGKKTT